MAISLLGVEVRSERRIRLTFSNNLAGGAFATPGPSYYTVTSVAADATSPTVNAALIVPGAGMTVELALSGDLVRGSLYTLSAVGVPAVDASVTPAGTTTQFVFGARSVAENDVEPLVRDRENALYGIDLIWNGSDFEEAPNGDLARVEGRAAVTKGLWRSIESSGLPWDPSWGVDAREWVDSPVPAGNNLTGVLAGQIKRDPRVASVSTEITFDNDKAYILITPTLIGGVKVEPVSTAVDNAT